VVIPPAGYLKWARELCTANNVVLILDEIQTGLERAGRLLAEEHEEIDADVTLVGKALSGGFYPMSAVLSNSEVLGVLKLGKQGSTLGGNPLACAVARAAIRVLVEEGMIENAAPARRPPARCTQGYSQQLGARGARPRSHGGDQARA
jgi:ornithine--oxo-acid transaminase